MLPGRQLLTTNLQLLTKRLATFSGHERGFTLIEMLVVIAIISILIGIGINTFTIAQKKARDVRRKADLRQIQQALEAFYSDTGSYPKCSPGGFNWIQIGDRLFTCSSDGTQSLTSTYLSQPLKDPLNNVTYYYTYNFLNGGQQYALRAVLEDTNDKDIANSAKDPTGTFLFDRTIPCAGAAYCLTQSH